MPLLRDASADFERASLRKADEPYHLQLYVSDASRNSLQAIANVKRLCEQYLPGRYELEIIDLRQQPELVAGQQVVAVPLLVKGFPPPTRKVIGNLADINKVLQQLELVSTPP
jgi:circadian clock protein KaiB